MLRVGVLGAGGRMGRETCKAVASDPELTLVSAVDPRVAGYVESGEGTGEPVVVAASIDELKGADAHVAVDFTTAKSALDNLRWCAENAVHAVVGTTGLRPEELSEVERLFQRSAANCVIAPNFAIGAVLMMRLAELAVPHMGGVEIIELHHDNKRDAPSGTAIDTARRLAKVAEESGLPEHRDATEDVVLEGARGGAGAGGIRIHSLRLPGVVAHQEVVFGAQGQSLTIRHDAFDRSAFMPGVILAIKQVVRRPGVTIGLEPLLGI